MAGKTDSGTGSGQPADVAKPKAATGEKNILYIIAYLLTIVGGIIVFLIAENDKKLKQHAIQAIALGVVIIIVAIISLIITSIIVATTLAATPYAYGYNPAAFGLASIIGLLFNLVELAIWVYGLYVGWQAYNGKEIFIPTITPLAQKYAK